MLVDTRPDLNPEHSVSHFLSLFSCLGEPLYNAVKGEVRDGNKVDADRADGNNLSISNPRNKWTRIWRAVLMPLESSCVFT